MDIQEMLNKQITWKSILNEFNQTIGHIIFFKRLKRHH